MYLLHSFSLFCFRGDLRKTVVVTGVDDGGGGALDGETGSESGDLGVVGFSTTVYGGALDRS